MADITKKKDDTLEHSQGGSTTRDDALDAGVPMIAGDPGEPIGPEDAFGLGPKRGDYSGRVDSGPHLVSEAIPDAKPGEPTARLVEASKRAGDIGEVKGEKGGVTT